METCEFCGKEFEDNENNSAAMQLKGHKIQCRIKQERKERVPFGVPTLRFNVPKDDGFVYRVFNDNWRKEPGRIQRALKAGYEVWEGGANNETVGTNDDGTEIKSVVMRIPQEFYEEDQRKKQEEIDKVDEQIHKGKFKQGQNDLRYLPGGGIRTENKLTG